MKTLLAAIGSRWLMPQQYLDNGAPCGQRPHLRHADAQ